MKGNRQAGFTMVELLIVVALLGMVVVPIASIMYQLTWMPGQRADALTLLHDANLGEIGLSSSHSIG